ncbi:hypothetical protein DL96DRAFT_598622 [Flagelloscypha sp. PMI_526]|nr:hypothetical protein DL96DRAFT_598622 [Flagelloscypha sp. PMI_526]
MKLVTFILLGTTLLGLTSATPMSVRDSTCPPPEASGVSIRNPKSSKTNGPIEFNNQELLTWIDAPTLGARWTFVKSGSNFKILDGTRLAWTPDLVDSLILLQAPNSTDQDWNITCTTCPENGLATNCSFKPIIQPDLCVLDDYDPNAGGSSVVFIERCAVVGEGSFTLDYHV